jgi:hypothetical protein
LLIVPFDSESVMTLGGTGSTIMMKACETFCCGELESATLIANVDCPMFVGVPEIVPAALNFNPAGKAPDATANE